MTDGKHLTKNKCTFQGLNYLSVNFVVSFLLKFDESVDNDLQTWRHHQQRSMQMILHSQTSKYDVIDQC